VVADSQPGHIDQIKQTNAGAVYRLIDQLGPVSRIDLSRLAQLAPASITKIVREMLEAHLVQETEIQEPGSRGRPAVGLVVETEAWHYLSLRISRGEIFLSLRDLSSKLVVEERQELPLTDEKPLLQRIIVHIDQFFIRHQQKLERLTAIAITLPGIIDTEHGIVHRMPFYEDVKDMPLGKCWNSTPVCRSMCSMISAPGPWQRRCLARRAGRVMLSRWLSTITLGPGLLPTVACFTQVAVAWWRSAIRRSTRTVNAATAVIMGVWKPLPAWRVCWNWRSYA
jgi:hypothetical protein